MEGDVRLTLEREPNSSLAGSIEGFVHQTLAARAEEGGQLVGMGTRAVMSAYVNGEPHAVGYLSQLRVDPGQTARWRLLAGGYAKLRELHQDGQAPFYITTIIEDNKPARRLLEAGVRGLPRYRALDSLVTLVIPVTRRTGAGSPVELEKGSEAYAQDIVSCLERNARRYQFARHWSLDDLRSAERTRDLRLEDFILRVEPGGVGGCAALWDQTGFKQSVVQGYSPWLRRVRPLVNLVGPLLQQPRLPSPGTVLKSAFVSHLAVDDDDPDVAVALLRGACAEAYRRGLDYVALGLCRRHPLLAPVKSAFPHREYVSVLYVVHWDGDAAGMPALDGRVPHPEMATL